MSKLKQILSDAEVDELMNGLENSVADEKYVEQLYKRFLQGETLDSVHEFLLRAAGKIPDDPKHPLIKKKEGA